MTKIIELFGHSTTRQNTDWQAVIEGQQCPYNGRTCYKVRKSQPDTAIGTCTVLNGAAENPVIICPNRLTERRQIFTDSLHLLSTHEPGNELHIIQEFSVPGGVVDFFLVSARDGRVRDFVGIEIQTLDTTGTVWPERQRLLRSLGVQRTDDAENSEKVFGMNWKMTAKTILVQIHHKIQTFEHLNKKLVLIVQDQLLSYMEREFRFNHLHTPALVGDSMHLFAYAIARQENETYRINLRSHLSTDASGIATCLGLQAEANIQMEEIVRALEAKISHETLFTPV